MTETNGAADIAVTARKAISTALRPEGVRFKPGQSGNPGGFSKLYARAKHLCQQYAPDLMQELINLAITAEDERVKSVCLIACLDRAGLRPCDFDPNAEKSNTLLDLTSWSQEDRDQLRALLARNSQVSLPSADGSDKGDSDPPR